MFSHEKEFKEALPLATKLGFKFMDHHEFIFPQVYVKNRKIICYCRTGGWTMYFIDLSYSGFICENLENILLMEAN